MMKIGKAILNLIYTFMKSLPQKEKITFISRQHNYENEDFRLVRTQIEKEYPSITCVVMTKMLDKGIASRIEYALHMLAQMYHIATSKAVVLDTYCIVVSILRHRKNLKVIQMWHAVGALKKYGYSVIGKEEGSSRKVAEAMSMHKNYSYVCISSERCRESVAEAFGVEPEKLVVLPLPRLDLLSDESYQEANADKIYQEYPNLKNQKKKILYAPTFRKKEKEHDAVKALINQIDFTRYELIVKLHPLSKHPETMQGVLVDSKFDTIDMLTVADYVITDYSALVFEAAHLRKPLFFYAYDLNTYLKKRGFYMDYEKEMPGVISDRAERIVEAIEREQFDEEEIERFDLVNINRLGVSYTDDFVKFLLEQIGLE